MARQRSRDSPVAKPLDKFRAPQHIAVQELLGRESHVCRAGFESAVDPPLEPGPDLFGNEPVRRLAGVSGQPANLEDGGVLGFVGQVGHAHLVDHPLLKRRDSLDFPAVGQVH
ncbi:MAG: hypothetical protein OXL68_12805 [Paracoccaceae bacterium]|nr:hypothetical protein [Paracoccaceae bacterium]